MLRRALLACLAWALSLAPAAAQALQGAPVNCVPTRAAFDTHIPINEDQDRLTRQMLRDGDHYLIRGAAGDTVVVVEKNYLDAARLAAICADIAEAREAVPRFVGPSAVVPKRLTIYLYGDGPISNARAPGVRAGEQGILLKFAKEDRAPTFHEMTHIVSPDGPAQGFSESLSEGIADVVQLHFRPGKAFAFNDAGIDEDAEARAALAAYPDIADAVGGPVLARFVDKTELPIPPRSFSPAPGLTVEKRFLDSDARFGFYHASASFARYLVSLKGMDALMRVYAGNGADAAYRAEYGRGLDELRKEWRSRL